MKRIKKNFADQSIGVAATEVNADIYRRLHTVVFPVTNNAVPHDLHRNHSEF